MNLMHGPQAQNNRLLEIKYIDRKENIFSLAGMKEVNTIVIMSSKSFIDEKNCFK